MKPYLSVTILVTLGLLILFIPVPLLSPAPTSRDYHLSASRYSYTPSVIRANPGDKVTIEFTSMDVVHGLAIDGYGQEMTADPGQTAQITFVADRSGVYRFRCTVTCGNMHPFMIGKLQVGPNLLYWRAALLGMMVVIYWLWKTRP